MLPFLMIQKIDLPSTENPFRTCVAFLNDGSVYLCNCVRVLNSVVVNPESTADYSIHESLKKPTNAIPGAPYFFILNLDFLASLREGCPFVGVERKGKAPLNKTFPLTKYNCLIPSFSTTYRVPP
ncbi:Hypothetical protein FKW44_000378 [Caligus rogercresseyi]|uniref:Uncharacterized protein n=1 Tax=Caligus rogercresseyi TaxID=217165 RepID=A0A7T8KHB6_CALRO|nr:Hypothetical protein FKW44_000378 [Caligus rogercresseyi]